MKINCEKCNEPITINVFSKFSQYEVGKIECPHCHKKQRRHISQSDLLIYMSIMCIFYTIMAFVLFKMFPQGKIDWILIVVMFVLLALVYIGQNYCSCLVYKHGFFKKDIMYSQQLYEEPKKIKRTLRIIFSAFLVLIVMLATFDVSKTLYIVISLIADLAILIYALIYIKQERSIK